MELAKNAINEDICLAYISLCYHILFAIRADHHSTNVRFHFHVCLKQLCWGVWVVWYLTIRNVPDIPVAYVYLA